MAEEEKVYDETEDTEEQNVLDEAIEQLLAELVDAVKWASSEEDYRSEKARLDILIAEKERLNKLQKEALENDGVAIENEKKLLENEGITIKNNRDAKELNRKFNLGDFMKGVGPLAAIAMLAHYEENGNFCGKGKALQFIMTLFKKH